MHLREDQPSVITGYYRYTDIKFEWNKAVPEESAETVRQILGPFSLVHPDHPLHVEGVTGAQLYHGIFQTGETRLLFSSRQVEFLRHWLHATGCTKDLLPLPYSDCLLTVPNELRKVTEQEYPTERAIKDALKKVDKNNKKLKNLDTDLLTRRFTFELAQTHWATHKGVWCAIDFESWERHHPDVTEIGYSYIHWNASGEEVRVNKHLIVRENRHLRNGQYVKDHRYNYNFGTSEEIGKKEFVSHVFSLILEELPTLGPVFLVFHDYSQDKKFLNDFIGLPVQSSFTLTLPVVTPGETLQGHFVIDTAELYGGLIGVSHTRASLDSMCKQLQIPTSYLHNAGNDAWYTLEALKAMALGAPLDIQREERWPNHTAGRSTTVQFTPREENSDYESGLDDDDED